MVRATPFAWETLRRYGFSFDDMRIFYIFFFSPDDWIHFLLAPSPKRSNDCAQDFPEQDTQGMLWMMSLGSIFGLSIGSYRFAKGAQ